jgi:8-oxo-dGTP pyrophosphatase MutT (NUDIX family)
MRKMQEGHAACMALAEVPDASRFGSVELSQTGKVTAFREKDGNASARAINSGVYCLSRDFLLALPEGPGSLEHDAFPRLVEEEALSGVLSQNPFLDIGTPASYAEAESFFTALEWGACSMFPETLPEGRVQLKLGTAAAILDDQGRMLLEKRSDCGWWGTPGGAPEAGETIAESAIREAHEETGITVEVTGLLGVFSSPHRRIARYPDNGDLRQLVDVVVCAKPVSGELKLSAESLDLRWFAPHEIPLNTIPPIVEVLRALSSHANRAILS